MKYLPILFLLLLTGCSSVEEIDFETISDSYFYSQEQIDGFIEKVQQDLDEALLYNKIEPGFDIYSYQKKEDELSLMKTIPGFQSVKLDSGSDYVACIDGDVFHYNIGLLDIDSIKNVPYPVKKLTFDKAFNNDLSLKIEDAFYGYTSVADPFYYKFLNQYDYEKYDKAINYVNQPDLVNKIAYYIDKIDNYYKNSNGELSEVLANYQHSFDILAEGEYGGTKLFKDLYRTYNADKSCNPLQTYLASRYTDYQSLVHELESMAIPSNSNAYEIDLFLDEYNYFSENKNYYLFYYPVSVNKVDEKVFLVDIETTKPVNDYTAEIIYYQIETKFNQTYQFMDINASITKEEYPEKMDIIVRLNNNDLNSGLLLERYMSSVLYPELATDYTMRHPNNIYDNYLRNSYNDRQEIPWYPNSEAQELLKVYFSNAKEAFDNNTYFSFSESIQKAASELDFNYAKAQSIVYSYYLICNGSRVQS